MVAEDSRQRLLTGFLISLMVLVASWQFLNWWSRPTAVEFDNLKYIQLLTTAVSARNIEMVNNVEIAVKKQFDAQEMSQKELTHFQKLIQLARDEKWEQANKACFEFAEAQLNRSRAQPIADTHSHSHEEHHGSAGK